MRFPLQQLALLAVITAATAQAQKSIAITEPPAPLLPASVGSLKSTDPMVQETPNYSLVNANKAALTEANPLRSAVTDYVSGTKHFHVEAIEFGDRSGAYSAFTLLEKPGMKQGKDLGALDAVGEGAVLFTVGSSVVLVNGATAADIALLKPLAEGLPKPAGNKAVFPLLPTLLPSKGLVEGSVRYALGPSTYAAQGGVLPAQGLGWDKSAEAVTAQYADKRGKETVTLLLYPTPTISGAFTRKIQDGLTGMGPSFAQARVRRELELVMLANGTFSGDEAQKMIENTHMKQDLSFDKDVQPVFATEVHKTYTLLQTVVIFCSVFGGAAVLLGLFLGFGRAWIRTLMGKPAAKEIEFLSLHLDPQNKAPDFHAAEKG